MKSESPISFHNLKLTRTLYGGLIAVLIVMLGAYFAGRISHNEGLDLIGELRPSLRFACAAMLTATSTILALILTLLSFSSSQEQKMRAEHYVRIQWIARFAIGTFIGSIILLLLLAIPLEHGSEKISRYYDFFYYFYLSAGALLAGVMVSIILMLYNAATEIILLVHPNKKADFLLMKDEEEVPKEKRD